MYSNLYVTCKKFPVLLQTSTCYEFNALKMCNARRLQSYVLLNAGEKIIHINNNNNNNNGKMHNT